MTAPSVRIGTRGTRLALAQANEVRRCLAEAHTELAGEDAVEVRIIRTSGDRLQQGSLSEAGGTGLFTKEIEKALLENEIDIAVHSMMTNHKSGGSTQLFIQTLKVGQPINDTLLGIKGLKE